ncbi:sigma-54-dependent Fis family transcriptional regulator [candidate division KSB1 bacterium]|nr:MAG: sigma-54-dependent Fis family transcriptional regulator [candidate division KSB1 bacterium]
MAVEREHSSDQLQAGILSSSSKDDMGIIGKSPVIRQIRETIRQIAPTNIPVLITGESGVGKELVAHAIHKHSRRATRLMLTVNCGAIPEGILESELFGHQRGAFTGAVETRKGYFELADGGTLFLDEIGELPIAIQVKLLRVLETKEFMRVGGGKVHQVDVRIIAATNKDLEAAVLEGQFRKDLFYRLNAIKIHIPSLRERREDIPLLIKVFTKEFCQENNLKFEGFSPEAIKMLQNRDWPGNVRELKNFVQSVIILERGQRITPEKLTKHLSPVNQPERNLPVPTYLSSEKAERELLYRVLLELKSDMNQIKNLLMQQFYPLHRSGSQPITVYEAPVQPVVEENEKMAKRKEEQVSLRDMERELIRKTLEQCNWNKRKAAQILKISERTLYRKIDEYNLETASN